jgi:hypothetical protein
MQQNQQQNQQQSHLQFQGNVDYTDPKLVELRTRMSRMVPMQEREKEGELGKDKGKEQEHNSNNVREYVTAESNRILNATYPKKPKIIKTTMIAATTVLLVSFLTLCVTKPSFVCETADAYEPREHRRLIIGTAAVVSAVFALAVLVAGGTQYFKSSV